MPKPINLPLATVIEKGRKAYLAGKLSAQGPSPLCAFRDFIGRPCVVGAALTDKQAERLDEYGGIATLAEKCLITSDDICGLVALQRANDNWASSSKTDAERAEGHATLRALLGLDPA